MKGINYSLLFVFVLLHCFSYSQKDNSLALPNLKADSLEKFIKALPTDDTTKVNALNVLCKELRNTGNYLQAKKYALEAEHIARTLNYKIGLGQALNNLGIVDDLQGDYPLALDYYFQALKAFEEAADKKGISKALNNIGIIYNYQGEDEKALEYYLKALKIMKETGDKRGISMSLNNVGIIYKKQRNYSKALYYYSEALRLREELGDEQAIAASYGNIGNMYDLTGDYAKAKEFHLKSLKIREAIDDKNGIASSYINLSRLSQIQKKFPEGIAYADRSLKLAGEIGSLALAEEAHNALYGLYEAQGNKDKALEHFKMYIAVRDSIFNEENTKQATRAEMNFEFEQQQQKEKLLQEKKDAIHNEELKRQKEVIYFMSAGLILVIAFLFVILNNYRQKQKANKLLEEKNSIIEEKNKNITDSINYARRIQNAILPDTDEIYKKLKQSFILYRPKDIVSGDFYYYAEAKKKIIIAAADCTGHGVPGAFMSMIGNDALNEIIVGKGIVTPGEILSRLHDSVRIALKQDTSKTETSDGMDVALCAIDLSTNSIEYAGALRNLYICRKESEELEIIEANKQSIGGLKSDEKKEFTNQKIQLSTGDSFYMFSDGYADQFGGKEGKKFMMKRMKDLILSIKNKSMKEQEVALEEAINEWKGDREQVDDILIIGIRL